MGDGSESAAGGVVNHNGLLCSALSNLHSEAIVSQVAGLSLGLEAVAIGSAYLPGITAPDENFVSAMELDGRMGISIRSGRGQPGQGAGGNHGGQN
jgi:hypothetical protein